MRLLPLAFLDFFFTDFDRLLDLDFDLRLVVDFFSVDGRSERRFCIDLECLEKDFDRDLDFESTLDLVLDLDLLLLARGMELEAREDLHLFLAKHFGLNLG